MIADGRAETPIAALDERLNTCGCGGTGRRALLDSLPAAIYTTDAAGRITYCNDTAIALAGRRPELGKDEWCVTWRLYWPDGTPMPHDQCPMAVALREDRAIRGAMAVLERPDRLRVPFLAYPTPLHDADGTLIGAVNMLVDLRDRSAADTARAYLAAIVECSDDAIVGKNLDGVVTSWNRGAEAIFGYLAEEMIGRPIITLFPPERLHEEDMILARLRRGERIDHFETVRLRKDGTAIDVSVTISPVHDSTGRIIGASKIARDITQKKRAEAALCDLNENLERRVAERTRELSDALERERRLAAERERAEAALRQSQKMDAIGQLAAGMAHDFNNLLTVILGSLELLDKRLPDDRLRNLVYAAMAAAQRSGQLNQQVLAFSRKQPLAPATVDLAALVGGIEDMLRRTLGGMVEVTTALPSDLWQTLVDPHQLELVLLNLAINARDAMPLGGRLQIGARNLHARDLEPSMQLSPADYVRVAVADTGTGMSQDVLARACEPFFTTKELGKGTGLGLAQVYGFAQQSGGGLRIASTQGAGTIVELYLPRSLAPRQAGAVRGGRPASGAVRQATVLVVDDQDAVRTVAVAQLEALGHRVLQAARGESALKHLDDAPAIDVLMIDYAMPRMSGTMLAEAARTRHPRLPVLIVTGYAAAAILDATAPLTRLLKKPYRMADLATAIEELLRLREGDMAPPAAGR